MYLKQWMLKQERKENILQVLFLIKNADKSSVFTKYNFFEFESESSAGTNKNYEDAIKKARALYGSKVANEIKIDVIRLA